MVFLGDQIALTQLFAGEKWQNLQNGFNKEWYTKSKGRFCFLVPEATDCWHQCEVFSVLNFGWLMVPSCFHPSFSQGSQAWRISAWGLKWLNRCADAWYPMVGTRPTAKSPLPLLPKKERKQLWWEQSTANLRGKHKIRFFSANFFSFFDFVKICLFCCFFCFFFACFLSLSVWEFWWNFFWHKIYQILAPLFPCKVINKETVEWGLCNLLAKNTERGKNTKPLPAIQGNKDLVNNILPRLWLWSNGCFWVVALSLSGWYWSQPPPQR